MRNPSSILWTCIRTPLAIHCKPIGNSHRKPICGHIGLDFIWMSNGFQIASTPYANKSIGNPLEINLKFIGHPRESHRQSIGTHPEPIRNPPHINVESIENTLKINLKSIYALELHPKTLGNPLRIHWKPIWNPLEQSICNPYNKLI